MRKMLRGLCALALCLALLLGPGATAADDSTTTAEKADALFALGLFRGKGTLPDGKPDYALIHDGARPFVTEEIIERNLEALKTEKACGKAFVRQLRTERLYGCFPLLRGV